MKAQARMQCLYHTLPLAFILAPTLVISCCNNDLSIRYCDSSAGFNVLQNGDYANSYCTRHAVMDLQKIAGLCLWRGGVAQITAKKEVICNDGTVSEMATLEQMVYQEGVGFIKPSTASERYQKAVAPTNYRYINTSP